MNISTEQYEKQEKRWPQSGQHILANFDDESIVVYQAYRPSIGSYAVEHQRFGGSFSLNRMSWIKPNFLWMMYRSGWGTKDGQQVILAIRIYRHAFETILNQAVFSSYQPVLHNSREEWSAAVANSAIRLQWDPDHAPNGNKLERRAIQLGLKGDILEKYASDWIISIEDISEFVAIQRNHLSNLSVLETPEEHVLTMSHPEIGKRIQLDEF